ncbi:MAG: GerMN domain-containing protein [Bacilli bacterium]|nr:GerMN domain-containing protein [Bacilli bacterium]
MLRKFAYNKIFRTTGMLLLFLLLLLFPASKEYSLEDEKVVKTNSSVKQREAFLIDKDGYVARCGVSITASTDEEYAEKLVELLIIGGKYEQKIPNGFKAILPSDTKINSVKINGSDITVDLSKEFYELNKVNEAKAIEALTYSLTSVNNVSNIYLNIEGKRLSYLPNSNRNVIQPFTRKNGVNKKYDVSNYKNVSETTVYYVNKNNTGYYYVPVTKISNDNRDKIKIIVDELTSSHIYETNLMSFLNYNTKLLSYDLKDEVLTLNFNNFLFDDANDKSILEEVVYSISLSVRDNYDVKEVIFTVDGNEITKSVLKNIE